MRERRGLLLALLLAAVGSFCLWVAEPYAGVVTTDLGVTATSRTFAGVSGPGRVLVVTLIPMLLAASAAVWPEHRRTVGFVLLAFVGLGAMSVGLYYLPAVAALLLWPGKTRAGNAAT